MANEPYELRMTPNAKRDIRRLEKDVAQRIMLKLLDKAENATTTKHKALKGEMRGLYSLRVGSYRALFLLKHDERLLVVEKIGHRRDVYEE